MRKYQKCKKCNEEFPSNGPLHGRSYCLKCSPPKSGIGYLIRKLNTATKVRECKTCPVCNKDFNWTKNNVCSGCRNALQRWEKRQRAVKLLGGRCKTCGASDPDILTFHHRNPKNKEFSLCSAWNNNWADIKKEIKKCDLLCGSCHLKLHAVKNQRRFRMVESYMINKRSSGEIADT